VATFAEANETPPQDHELQSIQENPKAADHEQIAAQEATLGKVC
jgi:hypothetical protein